MKDKYAAQKKYKKEHMLQIKATYKKEFVQEFNEALDKLNLRKSDVIREMMISIINKAKKIQ